MYHAKQFEFCSLGNEELVKISNKRVNVIRNSLKKKNTFGRMEWKGSY